MIDYSSIKEQQEANLLLKGFRYLLLAIVLTAAYINTNDITFKDYLSLIADQEEENIDVLSKEFEDEWRHSSVNISFDQIRRCDSLATDCQSFNSLHKPKGYSTVSSNNRPIASEWRKTR